MNYKKLTATEISSRHFHGSVKVKHDTQTSFKSAKSVHKGPAPRQQTKQKTTHHDEAICLQVNHTKPAAGLFQSDNPVIQKLLSIKMYSQIPYLPF